VPLGASSEDTYTSLSDYTNSIPHQWPLVKSPSYLVRIQGKGKLQQEGQLQVQQKTPRFGRVGGLVCYFMFFRLLSSVRAVMEDSD